MAGAEQWLGDNAKRIISAAGKRFICDACPCFSCADTIKVTFVGVDATVCTACCAAFGASVKAVTVTLDGVYTLTKVFEDDNKCNYNFTGGSYTKKNWANGTCSGKKTATSHNTVIEATVQKSNGNVSRVFATASPVVSDVAWSFGSSQPTPGGIPDIDIAFGVLIPNALTCCVAQHVGTLLGLPASSGGTAKVEDV